MHVVFQPSPRRRVIRAFARVEIMEMGGPTHSRRGAAIIAALAALVLPAGAGAGILGGGNTPKAEIATTGSDSELLAKIPIAKKPGTPRPRRDAPRSGRAQADRGRRPAARQRRGPGLDRLRRPELALRRPPLRGQPDGHREDRALAEPGGRLRLPAAVGEPQRALQAAAPEPQPPLHDRASRTPRPRSPTSPRSPARRTPAT